MSATTRRILRWSSIFALITLLTSCQMQGPYPSDRDSVAAVDDAPQAEARAQLEMVGNSEPPPIEPVLQVQPEPSVWNEIRSGFALDHQLEQPRVQQELRWLKRHPQYLPRLQTRLQRYLPYIHAEVRRRGLPAELTLLPIVESALDPYAFSHGGASGLWQFIPTTGKRFGLPRNWWYDGRRDPVLATRAALDYLELLEDRFDDWYLALAGYNAGEGNVQRALRGNGGSGDFFSLRLPRETSAYVPRLLALSAVVADPEAFGISLPEVAPEIPFVTLNTEGQYDLMKAAEALELDLEEIYQWNPALNQWSTPPEGPHRLHVPAALAEDAQHRLLAVPRNARVQWERVVVRSGDTLSHIARRHKTDVPTLRRANNLRGSQIRTGQALMIPRSSQAASAYPIATRKGPGDYQVQPGDSLWSIAKMHDVSVPQLVKANQIGPKEVLQVGQRLDIPGRSAAAMPAVARDTVRKVRYGVRRGDSLARIASKFNVRVNDLARWNALDVDRYLQPGQSLLIYVNVAAAAE